MKRAAQAAFVALMAVAAPTGAQEGEIDGVSYDMGDPDALVTVVEYADFACDACAQFSEGTWPVIRTELIETGRVRWRFVLFELGFRNSDEAARAGHCGAVLGDFFALHDALFARQKHWNQRRPKDRLVEVAVEAGFDEGAFRACYDDNPGKDRTRDANRAARDDGVRATPTFFVNGFQVQGALPPEMFIKLVENAESGR